MEIKKMKLIIFRRGHDAQKTIIFYYLFYNIDVRDTYNIIPNINYSTIQC